MRSSRYSAAMPTVDRALVRGLKQREDARFDDEHPRSLALLERGRRVMPNGVPMAWLVGSYHHLPMWVAGGKGARFTDVDGHTYHDFKIADMSMFCGYAPEPLVRAVADRMARGGAGEAVEPGPVFEQDVGGRLGAHLAEAASTSIRSRNATAPAASVSSTRPCRLRPWKQQFSERLA